MSDITQIQERIAPASPEAEEAVLGSMLINPAAIDDVLDLIGEPDYFIVRNGWVHDAIVAVHRRGEAVDNLTVAAELRARGRLDECGGSAYLIMLINNTPTHVHAATYARIVARAAMRRRILAAAGNIAQIALEDDAELGDIIARSEAELFDVTHRARGSAGVSLAEQLSANFDAAEQRMLNAGKPSGIPTGFTVLDRLLVGGGLGRGDLVLVAGRPGTGKTSFMLAVALACARHGASGYIASLEMSAAQLTNRLLSAESGIPSAKFEQGTMSSAEWGTYTEAVARLSHLPIFIEDTTALTVDKLESKIRTRMREAPVDVVFIDYIGLLGTKRGENRNAELSDISRSLKRLAMALNIPIVCLSQLSRNVEQRDDKRPKLYDLRESGALEQDADVVAFVYRDGVYHDKPADPAAELLVEKQRNGPIGMIPLTWAASVMTFRNR